MKKRLMFAALATSVACAVVAACGDSGAPKAPAGGSGGGSSGGGDAPYVRVEAPKVDNDKVNPIAYNAGVAEADGKSLFANKCSSCHGALGLGDGPTAKGAKPPAQDLTRGADFQDKVTDGYIFWKITKGNTGYKGPGVSLMYAFGNEADGANYLSENDRWKLVNYVRYLGGKK